MHKNEDNAQKTIEHQFDSFCKAVLRNHARNLYKEHSCQNSQYISLDSLPQSELCKLCFLEKYESDYRSFLVLDYDILVEDNMIADALDSLSQIKREIILLSFFLDMKNVDLADIFQLAESTIHHHKSYALNMLKHFLEENKDEES